MELTMNIRKVNKMCKNARSNSYMFYDGKAKRLGESEVVFPKDIIPILWPGRVAQSVGHLTRKSGVLGSIPGLATYFRFSFRFFKKGSCQLLAKVCARSTG